MKKLFVSLLAVAALAACTNEQTLVQRGNAPMEFAGAFVDNATRANVAADPSTTTNSLTGFDVWAFMDEPAGIVFEGEDVTGEKGNFSYVNTQYWVPEHVYYFAALAPMNSANWTLSTAEASVDGAGVVTFTNVDGTEDLLYAATSKSTVGMELGADMDAVKFQFNHLLSKVKFSFTNTFTNDNAYIDVKNVKMVVPAKGSINLAQADWWSTNQWDLVEGQNTTLEFGDACAKTAPSVKQETDNERLTIPADAGQSYIVTFDVALYFGDVLAFEKKGITSKVEGVALEIGKSYNFKAELNASNIAGGGENGGAELMPIVFDVEEVKDWVDGGEHGIVPTTPVATAEELVEAIAAGSNVTLTQDINLDSVATTRASSYGLFIEKDCVLDGAGHVITTSASRAIAVSGANDVTLKNFTLNATGERGLQVQGGAKKVTIENVTATSANYTVSLPSSAGATSVVINNCDLKGLNTINVAAPGAVVTVNDTIIRCEDNNTVEDYSAICVNKDGVGAKVYVNRGEVIITGTATQDSVGASVGATDGDIIFNETKGNTTVSGRKFAIMYGDYYYSFATFEAALAKAVNGETIKLLQDVTVESQIVITKNITFDLNGKTLTAAAEDKEIDAIWVRDDAEVVITGNGTIDATYDALFATGNSKVTIVNGTFIGAAEAVYVQANASVEILGGSFKSTQYPQFTLNIKDAARATASIVVKGGQYYQFNPANNAAEGANTNFVADGYTVEQNGDWYIVK